MKIWRQHIINLEIQNMPLCAGSPSLGLILFRFQHQSSRFYLIWQRNGTKMVPKWNRTSTKKRKIQMIPWEPCTEALVSSIRNELRYRNRYRESAGTEATVPGPNHKFSASWSLVANVSYCFLMYLTKQFLISFCSMSK